MAAQPGVGEVAGLRPLLADLDLARAVVTADALPTKAGHARWLVEDRLADYVFTVKDNQPGLVAAIEPAACECGFPRSHQR